MRHSESDFMVTYIDAATAPLKNTGAIRLYDAEAFEGMRRAGRLAAECLDMLVPEVKPGVTTGYLDDLAREFVLDHGGPPELVPPGTGYVLPMTTREDIVTRLRQLLTELREDPAQLHTAGELAQAHVRKYYSWEAKAVQIHEVYRWVLGHRAAKPDWGTPMGFASQTVDSEVSTQPMPQPQLIPDHGF